jgi:signal transduction histidine kinase
VSAIAEMSAPLSSPRRLTRLSAHGWWLLPLLLCATLLLLRQHPSLAAWQFTEVKHSDCEDSNSWDRVALPRFSWGRDCQLFLAERDLDTTQLRDQALLLSGVGRDLRIWVNGTLVHELEPSSSQDGTSLPQLLTLQPNLLRSGRNEILMQVHSGVGHFERSYLGNVFLGPMPALQPAFERSIALGQRGAQLAIVIGLAILLTLLPIAWSRPRDSGLRWFAVAVISSLIYIWNMGWPLRPLPSLLWHLFAHGGLTLALWAILQYSMHIQAPSAGFRRWIRRLSILAVAALLAATFDPVSGTLSQIADPVFRLCLLCMLLMLTGLWWQHSARGIPLARWMAAAALLNLVLGIVDSLRVMQLYGADFSPFLLHWGILYLLSLLLVLQLRRILAALATAEHLQEDLAAALRERGQQLELEFGLRQQAEHARMLAEERQRIMRDMHDGVGGQLVALIGQAEAGRLDSDSLKPQLRRSLDDLRLMIDSLDDACADLSVALGMLRQRLQPGLQGLSISVRWHTAHLPDLAPCTPDVVLQVLRIIQEAITNALKHARCQQLLIDADWSEGWLELSVSDDGVGLPASVEGGRGLPSMRQRAHRIGAELEFLAATPGTRVRLRMRQALAHQA